jgi:hypothetical protein
MQPLPSAPLQKLLRAFASGMRERKSRFTEGGIAMTKFAATGFIAALP